MRAQYGLVGRLDALRTYHAPERMEDLAAARKRLVFEELFMVQLALLLRRQRLLAARSEVDLQGTCIGGSPLLEAARRSLPFALTEAQERALGEVLSDMAGPVPMMRLLQVGGGCGPRPERGAGGARSAAAGPPTDSSPAATSTSTFLFHFHPQRRGTSAAARRSSPSWRSRRRAARAGRAR